DSIANKFLSEAPPTVYPTSNFQTVADVETNNHGITSASSFPSDLPVLGDVIVPLSLTHNAYQWHFRVDYNVNQSKDRLFFDLFRTYSDQLSEDAREIYRNTVPNTGFYAKIDWTHTFSPTLLNEAGFTAVRAVGSNPGTSNNRDLPNA